jgi:hypothetical protein
MIDSRERKTRNIRDRNLGKDLRDKSHTVLKYVKGPLLAAFLVGLADSLGLLLSLGYIPKTTLVLVLFLEGGIGLMVGVGISLSSTPSVSRLGETLFGTASWSREAEKHAEKVGWKWMAGSSLLVLIGFAVSVA